MIPAKQSEIYWEEQGTDRMCGVHCINSLLQGPFYNEVELANIALELDAKERQLIEKDMKGASQQIKKLMQGESNNVSEDGNYSIQVLTEALSQFGTLQVESVDSRINQSQDLSSEKGFICNSASHWFSIRIINSIWFNLNSTNDDGPEIISDFYLSAFLQSVRENGYHIFVVKGEFPQSNQALFSHFNKNQKWIDLSVLKALHESKLQNQSYNLNIGGTDERDLEKALKKSQAEYEQKNKKPEEQKVVDKQEEQQDKMFTGTGVSMAAQGSSGPTVKNYQYFQQVNYGQDPQYFFILQMSLESKFEIRPQQGIEIKFKHFNGEKLDWQFDELSRIQDLYDFIYCQRKEGENYTFYLTTGFPLKKLVDLNKTILEQDIESNSVINVIKDS